MSYFSADAIEMLRINVLEEAVEDYKGLWELVPLAERTLGRSAMSFLVEALCEVVLSLRKDGLIAFYQGNPQPGDKPVDLSTVNELIGAQVSWEWDHPSSPQDLWIGASAEGEKYFNMRSRVTGTPGRE